MVANICRKHHPHLGMVICVSAIISVLSGLSSIAVLPPFPDLLEVKKDTIASDISLDWLEAVEENIRASEYQVTWQEQTYLSDVTAAYQTPNRAQNLRVYFTSHGLTIIPRQWDQEKTSLPWRWDLDLTTWGYKGALHPVQSAELITQGNHVDYQRQELVEWYQNDESGLEQGFTLLVPPSSDEDEDKLEEEATIILELALSGDLTPVLTEDSSAVDFMTAGGAHVLRYGDLLASDATGRSLNAQFQLIPSAISPSIDILIEAGQAIYPITVDPMLTTPSWSIENYSNLGYSVGSANVNGDAYSDVIIGWPYYDGGEAYEGRVLVYHGSASGLDFWENWSAEGNQVGAQFGASVGSAGDVNQDGYEEIIIGTPLYDTITNTITIIDAGQAFVYQGSASGLSTSPAWTAEGNQQDAQLGYSVGAAGDVNQDSYDDVIIGAPYYDNGENNEGGVFVWYGSSSGLGDPGTSANADWWAESNTISGGLGFSVGAAGDVKKDGYGDIIIGMRGGTDKVFVWYGSSSGLGVPPGNPTNANWRANPGGSSFDYSLGTAGDLNGDGADEVIVSALSTRKVFVWYGSDTGLGDDGLPANADWTVQVPAMYYEAEEYWLDGLSVSAAGDVDHDSYGDVIIGVSYRYFAVDPEFADEYFARAYIYRGSSGGLLQTSNPDWQIFGEIYYSLRVSEAGDVNGDGFGDILIGAPMSIQGHVPDPGITIRGRVFVFYGASYALSASPGWTTEINQEGAGLGFSVSTAGDVNGDGYADVLVGAPLYDNGQTDEGQTRVYHGSAGGLSGLPAWTAEIDQQDAQFGFSVGSAGDVNGDGYSDVVIGAPYYSNVESSEGKTFLYHGSASGLGVASAWSAESDQADAHLGYAVGSAGDVNGDGYADLVVGAPLYDNGQTDEGQARVYHGSASGLSASPAWTAEGDQQDAHFGFSVSTAGYTNNDGYADLVIGAPDYDNGELGEGGAFTWYGSAAGLGASGIPGNAAWSAESNQANARFGFSVSTAGDVNGDGYVDLLVGAPYYDYAYGYGYDSTYGYEDGGKVYLFNGSTSGLEGASSWAETGGQKDSHLGYSLSAAGDVNGDVYADVLIGEPGYTNSQFQEGRALLYQGSAAGPGDTADWTMEGNQDNSGFGSSVGSAGDVNGDGYADVIVGASGFDNGQNNEGRAFLFKGSNQGLQSTAAWWYDGKRINNSYGVSSLSSAGDVNGDGYEDAILGWPTDDPPDPDFPKGKVVVFHGSDSGFSAEPNWIMLGSQENAFFGASVSGAGDVNGDGYDDVIIGAPNYWTVKQAGGRAYVYYGSPNGLANTPAWWVESNNYFANLGASVDTAGDVNGDGYSDVIVGVPRYDDWWGKLAAFVYHGSASGLSPIPNWSYISGNFENDRGSSVSTAGDVNGDGYDDVIMGRGSNGGWAYVFHGSSSGLKPAPTWTYQSGQAGALLGWSVNQAGDVNGDGYDDVIVGAPDYDRSGSFFDNEGRAYVFYGSSGGLSPDPNWLAYGGHKSAFSGTSVNTAGDVNGDGYSDVVVGEPHIDPWFWDAFYGEGQVQVYLGTASGLSTSANWSSVSDQQDAYGYVAGAAGDVNSDGYSDLLVGAPRHNAVGRAFLYYGLSGGGLQPIPQQRLADNSARVLRDMQSGSPSQVRLASLARTPFGRSGVRIQWEIKPKGVSFNGTSLGQSVWADSGVAGYTYNELVSSLAFEKYYHWRMRILGRPANAASNSAITYRSPWLPGLTFVTALSGIQPITGIGHTDLLGQSSYVDVHDIGSSPLITLTLTGYPDTAHPQEFSTPGMDRLLNRYYTIVPNSGALGYKVDVCLAYDDKEIGGWNEGYIHLCSWSASEGWHCFARGIGSDTSTNLVCAENVDAFSDWVLYPQSPTVVTMSAFYATPVRDGILLNWETAQEAGNLGFNLYRRHASSGEFIRLNADLVPAQTNGSLIGATYKFLDTQVIPGETYAYQLEDIGIFDGGKLYGPIEITFLNLQIYLPVMIRR